MENPSNPESEHSHGDRAADASTSAEAGPQPQSERRVFDALRDAILKGAEDAKTAAEKAVPKVKSAATSAVYWTAYGVSYAAVFQWTFAKGITSESLKWGLRDGVKGGMQAAEKWIEKLKQRKAKSTSDTPELIGPSSEAGQPGTA